MKKKIVALLLIVFPLTSFGETKIIVKVGGEKNQRYKSYKQSWEEKCRHFASYKSSTQNCESIYRETLASLTLIDQLALRRVFAKSEYCPITPRRRVPGTPFAHDDSPFMGDIGRHLATNATNRCRYHQIELAALIKARGQAECNTLMGMSLQCRINGHYLRFQTVSRIDAVRISNFYATNGSREHRSYDKPFFNNSTVR